MINSKRSPASGPSIWRGADLVTQDRWVYQFTFDDIKELDAALEKLPPNISDLRKITTVAYPLPTQSKKFTKYACNKNAGYGTNDHLYDIKKFGITKHHRKKFGPIHKMLMSLKRETL